MRVDARMLCPLCAALLAGCDGPQSALAPAGPTAASIHVLGLFMYLAAVLVTTLVTILALLPFLRRRERSTNRSWFLWGGGVVLPAAAVALLVPYVSTMGHETRAPDPVRITADITGHVYWWEISYRRADGQPAVGTANELRLPAGEPVELKLHAADVIHSFWVPRLAGKTDMIPGRVTRMRLHAEQPGIFRGQCAEYCGLQHALMAFEVIVVSRAEFDAWLERLAQPVNAPLGAELRAGREHFLGLGCGACHAVRGVSEGRLGPDLTQVGARRMIGAGALPGGTGNIAGWIASAQHLKPGNAMPSYDRLEGRQLRELAAWLGSLQ